MVFYNVKIDVDFYLQVVIKLNRPEKLQFWVWELTELCFAMKCWPRQIFLGISYQNVMFLNKLLSARFYG